MTPRQGSSRSVQRGSGSETLLCTQLSKTLLPVHLLSDPLALLLASLLHFPFQSLRLHSNRAISPAP